MGEMAPLFFPFRIVRMSSDLVFVSLTVSLLVAASGAAGLRQDSVSSLTNARHGKLSKDEFIDRYGSDYGYGGRIDALYDEEIGTRMRDGHYLDATGAALYWNSQAKAYAEDLERHVFGNPHSVNPPSQLSEARVAEARRGILALFNVTEATHELILTRSGTGALNLLADSFPWTSDSRFAYTLSNHNSVLGIRNVAKRYGARYGALGERAVTKWLADDNAHPRFLYGGSDGAPQWQKELNSQEKNTSSSSSDPVYSLFAYPAKDNYNGVLYPLDWAQRVQAKSNATHRWMVLLDAAAYVPTSPLDLSRVPADYVIMSFYKLFGLPTGVGALIARKESTEPLRKGYWGGGAIFLATSGLDWHAYRGLPERLEDGTLPFLDIVALQHGLRTFETLGGPISIGQHTKALKTYAYERLRSLKHGNGAPLLRIFGKHARGDADRVQGATLNFLILDPQGEAYSYRNAAVELAKAGIYVRVGCTCNPGSCYGGLGLLDEEVRGLAEQRHHNWTDWEWISVQRPVPGSPGKTATVTLPLGSIRAALGAMSRYEDVEALASFLEKAYIDRDLQEQKTLVSNSEQDSEEC